MHTYFPRIMLIIVGLLVAVPALAEINCVWREAETADHANFDMKAGDWGHPEWFSGGKWLEKSYSPEEMEPDALPDVELTYKMAVPKADHYHLWLRIGFEFARPPLKWRMDGGEWNNISPRALTRDMTELSFFAEVGWLDAGNMDLTAGTHTVEIVGDEWLLDWGKDKKTQKPVVTGKSFRLALDVVALISGDWLPCWTLKPGEEPNGENDKKAEQQVYELPLAKDPGARTEVSLTGLWQVCRDDDMNMNLDPYAPQTALPPAMQQHWRGAFIPANQWQPLPAAISYAHRVWYRTRVKVPAEYAGRGFYLHFFGTNWIASVVVNGQYVGFHKGVRVPWDIDISSAVKPGQVNEICVGIKDLWYGIDNPDLDHARNIPLSFVQKFCKMVGPFFPSTKGDADGTVSGITDWVNMVVAGGVYTQDVAIRPSVAKKTLTVVATVINPGAKDADIAIGTEAIFDGTKQVEHRIPPVNVTIPAGKSQQVTLSAPWENPKLWFPEMDPAPIYTLRTTITQAGAPVDVFEHDQHFGFREVTVDGIYIRINGLRHNFWDWTNGFSGHTEQDRLANYHAENDRFARFGADLGLTDILGPRCYQLDWSDKHGIPGRMCSEIDGMGIQYNLFNPVTWENFNEHIDQETKAYRNHPSVICYSLENELMLINARLGCGDMVMCEKNAKVLQDIAHKNDPTRPCMMDGAGALQDNYLDICNTHYAEDGFTPDNALPLGDTDANAPGVTVDPNWRGSNSGDFVGLWHWDHKRPYCAGEIAYFSGDNIEHTWIGGGIAGQDRTQAQLAYGKYVRYIYERYRWNDVAIIAPCVGRLDNAFPAMKPLAAFTREYNTCFFAGKPATRTVKVFNDTFSKDPVTFSWRLEVNGVKVAGNTQALTIEPGFGQVVPITFTPPAVATRTPATLVLEVTQPGSPSFADSKDYSIYPARQTLKIDRPLFMLGENPAFGEQLAALGVHPHIVTAVNEVTPAESIVLIPPMIGQDLPSVADFIKNGGRVVCLEQDKPFAGDKLPAPLAVAVGANNQPGFAYWVFPSGMTTPLFAGMGENDFSNWAGFTPTAKALWQKPIGLARAWLNGGSQLASTALIEEKSGQGIALATQISIGTRLATEPAARQLLLNMLSYADTYQDAKRPVSVYASTKSGLEKTISELGCRLRGDRPLDEALTHPSDTPIIVAQANLDNMSVLLKKKDDVEQYVQGGGWIMLCNLEPDMLDSFNQLLGTKHVMREFRVEAVDLKRDPFTCGMDGTDFAMMSKQMLAEWANMKRMSQDVFTYCVDASDDIAPFCFGPPNPNYKFGDAGGGPLATVNGLTNTDFWMYIDQTYAPKAGDPFVSYSLPSPCKLAKIKIWNNANYNTIKDLDIVVDGKVVASVVMPDGYGAVEKSLDGLQANATVSLNPKTFYHGDGGMMGIDLVQITRQTPEWLQGKAFPLVEDGALVRYPRGKGGFVLNQLKMMESEPIEYLTKKQRVLSALLHNMGASFDVTKTTDAGPGEVDILGGGGPE